MDQILEIDILTGKKIVRDHTKSENEQREKDLENFENALKITNKNQKLEQQQKAAAVAHAKSLGFTDQMISVMYPNLGA